MRVGLVGGGGMAQVHLRSLLRLAGAEVCGLAALEVAPDLSDLCQSQRIPVGTDMEWLLDACRPGAIVVATPTDTHAVLVAEAARAGCHVFCEKPLGRTAAEAANTLSGCEEAGVKLAVGHVVRYFPAYARIAEMVKAGQIGPPGMAKCRRVSGPPGGQRGWYRDAVRSGGLILDMGVHDFDWLRWCLGPVERVSALTSPANLGQAAMVVLAHVSGAISVVELSWMDPEGFATTVEVSGPKGLVRHDSRRSPTYRTERWPANEGSDPAVRVHVATPTDDPYRDEVAAALSWFGGGPQPKSTGLDAVAAVALAEAAELSAVRGEPVPAGEVAPEGAL
jgi:predicted dehydrogenase